jgi:hypothetical protein
LARSIIDNFVLYETFAYKRADRAEGVHPTKVILEIFEADFL